MKTKLFTLLACIIAMPSFATHPLIQQADALQIKDYTIPTFIQMMVQREKARADESTANIQALQTAVDSLQSKYEPYCEVVNINGDPTTRMAFNWFTNDSIFQGEVQLVAKANATEADFSSPIVVPAQHLRTIKNKKGIAYAAGPSGIAKAAGIPVKQRYFYTAHKAVATGLTPDQTYSYRVGFAGHWSEIGSFHTAETQDDEVEFLVMSDSHIQNQAYVDAARYCATAAAKNHGDVDFCLFPGDFAETGDDPNAEWEWERWFEEAMPAVIHQMPIVPTDGNHDDSKCYNYTYHFNADTTFNSIAINKPQFHGITYSFMYGSTLFLVYSLQDWGKGGSSVLPPYYSEYLHTDVSRWFRDQVAAHPEAKLRVSVSHKNIFSGSGHQEDGETPVFRDMMLPVFADCEIDLAIQGHDHCYEVIGPVNPWTRTAIDTAIVGVQTVTRDVNKNETGKYGGTFNVNDGTLYFISATCGAKRYYPLTAEEMDAQYNIHKVQNYHDLFTSMFGQPEAPVYSVIDIKGSTIEIESYTTDKNGNSTKFHEFEVRRTRPHGMPTGYEVPETDFTREGTKKVLYNGQFLIVKEGHVYNAQGARVEL